MISEAEALDRILAAVLPAGRAQSLPLAEASGRIATADVFAGVPIPAFDQSSMDGYAVRAADSQGGQPLQVVAEQPAGIDLHHRLDPGTAIRIFTGASLPEGSDAVVMQEDVEVVETDGGKSIRCREPVSPGDNIRRTGADLCRGQKILSPGDRLTAARIGLLASQGLDTIEVAAVPRVAILSTGDELAPPGRPLRGGQIYNSNGPMLQALLHETGIRDSSVVHCPDDLDHTAAAIERIAASHDFLIISGGVSVGDRDVVKPALARLGIPPDLWRVRIRPGKPFLFARRDGPRPFHIFGLPGNPVSSFVTFLVFVRPALLRWMGCSAAAAAMPSTTVKLGERIDNPGDRTHYVRGRVLAGLFRSQSLQQSHALFSLSEANALLRLEAGETADMNDERQAVILG